MGKQARALWQALRSLNEPRLFYRPLISRQSKTVPVLIMKEMKKFRRSPSSSRRGEEGYTLVAVVVLLALLTIWLAVAVPKIAKQVQRDRELETIHRGKQYARAIKLYYKKFGTYPPSVNALMNTNDIHFLRRKYIDPTTGRDEWTLIRSGQIQAQLPGLSSFGQSPMTSGSSPAASSSSSVVSSSPNLIAAAENINASAATGTFGDAASSSSDSNATNANSSSVAAINAAAANASFGSGGTGQGGQTFGSGVTGQGGQTFGLEEWNRADSPSDLERWDRGAENVFGGFMVITGSPKESIVTYKKHTHFNEWQFIFSPGKI